MQSQILIVDDYIDHAENLKEILRLNHYFCQTAYTAEDALKKIKKRSFDLILLDDKLPGMDGLELVRLLREENNDVPVIMFSAFGDSHKGSEAAKLGVYDFIPKGDDLNELYDAIETTIQKYQILASQKFDAQYFQQKYNFIGISPQIKEIFKTIEHLANSDARVLITGETGVGKNLLAELIHQISPRASKPFVWLDCPAIPETLLESELFGHERGAFTGAVRRRIGRLYFADQGTLLVDQIDDLSLAMQAKFLRFIETGEFEPLGSTNKIKVDLRVISTSNEDLNEKINQQQFRQDLYYRIAQVEIFIPPLRERKEDIPFLARHFIRRNCIKYQKPIFDLTSGALDLMLEYEWPGNVRELQFFIENVVLLKKEGPIFAKDVEMLLGNRLKNWQLVKLRPLREAKEEFEKSYIEQVLAQTNGNISKAAKILGIDRSNLYKKIQYYRILLKPA